MVSVGKIKKVDKLGRISIPIELRRTLGYGSEQFVEMTVENEYVKMIKMDKGLGIVRRIDDLGRVVIPLECRMHLYIQKGDPVEILTSEEAIYIKKYENGCVFCGEVENIKAFRSKHICSKCLEEIRNAY